MIANDIVAGSTVRPLNNSQPPSEPVPFSISAPPPAPEGVAPLPSFVASDIRHASEAQPMTVALLVEGSWQIWPSEALFEVLA